MPGSERISFLLLPFICLLSAPFGLEVLEGIAYILLPDLIPAPSTRPGTQCLFAGRRKEGRKGRSRRDEGEEEGGNACGRRHGGGLGVGSPASPPPLLHTILFQISVAAFT